MVNHLSEIANNHKTISEGNFWWKYTSLVNKTNFKQYLIQPYNNYFLLLYTKGYGKNASVLAF